MEKVKLFLQDARREFRRVNWPAPGETAKLTLVVVVMALLMAVFLGFFDLIFLYSLDFLLLFK